MDRVQKGDVTCKHESIIDYKSSVGKLLFKEIDLYAKSTGDTRSHAILLYEIVKDTES